VTTKYACPCCGYHTLAEQPPGTFEICPVCYWEDDNVQYSDPTLKGGANEDSLEEARANFKEFRASSRRFVAAVRLPADDEL
jgi:hypothetical protein